MDYTIITNKDITYIEKELFDKDKNFIIKSSSFYKNIPIIDIKQFCVKHAFYNIPTIEQIEFLKNEIGKDYTIEIGSGNGILAKQLGIRATDSMQQNSERVRLIYDIFKQPTINYGQNVEQIDAVSAVKKYKPYVTLATWVTHKFEFGMKTGNDMGIEEEKIIKNTKNKYILIGNKEIHYEKPIFKKYKYKELTFDWLVSRRGFDKLNTIWIFEK